MRIKSLCIVALAILLALMMPQVITFFSDSFPKATPQKYKAARKVNAPQIKTGTEVGNKAPEFTLKDTADQSYTLSKVVKDNKVTIINFWATWCPPCRAEIPDLIKFYNKYKSKGVLILGVNLNESKDQVAKFKENNKISFPLLLDTGSSTAETYLVSYIPMTFVIDSKGIIRNFIGGMTDYDTLEKAVRSILEEK